MYFPKPFVRHQTVADSKGYEYLLRAGFIRQMGAGIFSLLPFGFIATRKISQIIREEMDEIGAQELLMPLVNTGDIWKETGRFYSIDKEMSRFIDRSGRDMVTCHDPRGSRNRCRPRRNRQLQASPPAGLPNPDKMA